MQEFLRGPLEFLNRNSAAVTGLAVLALVFLTGLYVWLAHRLLSENRRQADIALGRDARSAEERRRRLQLLGRRLTVLVSDVAARRNAATNLRWMPLWTEDELGQLETLGIELFEVDIDDVTRLLRAMRDMRDRISRARKTEETSDDSRYFAAVLGGSEFFGTADEAVELLARLLKRFDGGQAADPALPAASPSRS
ncbi:MAG: hypothetical protein ACREMX_08035 [Gemmatimonadales bacterium]